MPYALNFYIYLFFANVLALVIVARWIRPFGFVVRYRFWMGVCLCGDSRRLAGVWKESVVARGLKVFLTLMAIVSRLRARPSLKLPLSIRHRYQLTLACWKSRAHRLAL